MAGKGAIGLPSQGSPPVPVRRVARGFCGRGRGPSSRIIIDPEIQKLAACFRRRPFPRTSQRARRARTHARAPGCATGPISWLLSTSCFPKTSDVSLVLAIARFAVRKTWIRCCEIGAARSQCSGEPRGQHHVDNAWQTGFSLA